MLSRVSLTSGENPPTADRPLPSISATLARGKVEGWNLDGFLDIFRIVEFSKKIPQLKNVPRIIIYKKGRPKKFRLKTAFKKLQTPRSGLAPFYVS